jgi:lysophospholipase L1-like esterase
MKLYAFGDSWTAGQGANIKIENSIESNEDRRIFRNSKSWPKLLADLLNITHHNLSISGCDNNTIFNSVIECIKSNKIKSGDLIIIMWSSTLRDRVPFFPDNEWHVWGENYITSNHKNKWFVSNESTLTKNPTYNNFLIKFKEFYIDELYNESYYNIINQNYILFIQKLCEYYNINYLFCDAFDKMVNNPNTFDNKTQNINKTNYWQFSTKTMKELLIETNDKMMWETPQYSIFEVPGMHPSELGYMTISKELYRYIKEFDIVKFNSIGIDLKFI